MISRDPAVANIASTIANLPEPGLKLVRSGAIMLGTTAQKISNIFTADYRRYRLVMRLNRNGNFNTFLMRYLDASNNPIVSPPYFQSGVGPSYFSNNIVYFNRSSAAAQFTMNTGQAIDNYVFDICDPYTSNLPTTHSGSCVDYGAYQGYTITGMYDLGTVTGISVYLNALNANLQYSVYGYLD